VTSQTTADAAGNRLREIAWTIRRGVVGPAARTSGYNVPSAATPLPLLAQTGEKGMTVWLGETAVSGATREHAMDLQMAFVLQSLA
jgi:hypothetical protein